MQRLGKNLGRYHGETIDIRQVQRDTHRLALDSGFTAETFLKIDSFELRAYHRSSPGATKNLYISAGIHGDEPSGPLALKRLLEENNWPDANLWLVPCLNPAGFAANTRENQAGIDLNRDYRHLHTAEVRAHVAWLERQPKFDLTLVLHEDWEANGFYVYELNPHHLPTLAERIVAEVQSWCVIETADLVDDWPCTAGIIRPAMPPSERPQWAESLYLIVHKTPLSYTLETPSDFALDLRVEAHIRAVRAALDHSNPSLEGGELP